MPTIIDTAEDCTRFIPALKSAGIKAVIRYDDRKSKWKQVKEPELRALAKAGLKVGIVYEHVAKPSGMALGFADAAYSLKLAAERQPEGSAIYFAVDYDPSATQIRNDILPYFRGVYRAFKESKRTYRVGAYCSGLCADALRKEFPEILIWITCSMGFAGSREWVKAQKYDLWQTKCDVMFKGLDCDFDKPGREDWGQFVPYDIATAARRRLISAVKPHSASIGKNIGRRPRATRV
jgi:hypothetical protein